MKNPLYFLFLFFGMLLALSCGNQNAVQQEAVVPEGTPVTVTSVTSGTIEESTELNATSAFLLKTPVKSSVNGYIQKVNVAMGSKVKQGQTLFILKTKEAQSLGNSINVLDTSFHFSGIINVRSPNTGFIIQLNHQAGDYVQDGEQLVTISDANSFYFLMNVPFESKKFLPDNNKLILELPDGEKIPGILESPLPAVDSASQTVSYKIRALTNQMIPEKLIAKVHLMKEAKTNAVSLPKACVLADETQTDFWVMKMIDDSTAVKVPVQKGIETRDRVEILSPQFSPLDKILLSGNYGLSDTAKVSVVKSN